MSAFRDSPLYRLSRHFFSALFDLGFLSEAGAESFERMVAGICTVFFSFGLLLVRIFMGQLADLSRQATPEPFREALLGIDAFVMALPMWIVAFVTVLVSHALFPDETDFRVLIPLPISRRLVFGAKLLALATFCGLFIVAAHIALTPLTFILSGGRWAEHPVVVRMAAFGTASVMASIWAVSIVTSANGLLVLAASRSGMMGISAALRSMMLCGLVLALPFIGRLPATGPRFTTDAAAIYASPPSWFVGLEQVLLGHATPQFLKLAGLAGAGLAVTLTITGGTYALLYRHFERVTRKPAGESSRSAPAALKTTPIRLLRRSSVYVAIRSFIATTLRRSALHQGVLVFISAMGVGIALNSGLDINVQSLADPDNPLARSNANAAVWMPFVLILFAAAAARSTLTLPTEQRANWVFRMTEDATVRLDALRAAFGSVMFFGVTLPLLALAPVHGLLFGVRAVSSLMVTFLMGMLLVEILMRDWMRIPFTCSYIPGKRFVPQSLLIGFVAIIVFTGFGVGIAQINLARPGRALVPDAVLLGIVLLFRNRRLRRWQDHPLMFEDVLPTEVNPLRLSAD